MTPRQQAAWSKMVREMGSRGGKATAAAMTPEQRQARASNAAQARWAKRQPTSESDDDLNRRVRAALKSERISRAVRAAKDSAS